VFGLLVSQVRVLQPGQRGYSTAKTHTFINKWFLLTEDTSLNMLLLSHIFISCKSSLDFDITFQQGTSKGHNYNYRAFLSLIYLSLKSSFLFLLIYIIDFHRKHNCFAFKRRYTHRNVVVRRGTVAAVIAGLKVMHCPAWHTLDELLRRSVSSTLVLSCAPSQSYLLLLFQGPSNTRMADNVVLRRSAIVAVRDMLRELQSPFWAVVDSFLL